MRKVNIRTFGVRSKFNLPKVKFVRSKNVLKIYA